MLRLLIQNWWLLLVRGIFALAFAICIFVVLPFIPAPLLRELAFAGIAAIFALLAITTGVITIAAAVYRAEKGGSAWLLLADGIAVASGGLVILLSPALTLGHVILLIAATSLLAGTLETAAGFHVRRHVKDEWFLIACGLISILFAGWLPFQHTLSSQTVLSWISVYAAISGLAMSRFALRLRSLRNSVHALAKAAVPAKG